MSLNLSLIERRSCRPPKDTIVLAHINNSCDIILLLLDGELDEDCFDLCVRRLDALKEVIAMTRFLSGNTDNNPAGFILNDDDVRVVRIPNPILDSQLLAFFEINRRKLRLVEAAK